MTPRDTRLDLEHDGFYDRHMCRLLGVVASAPRALAETVGDGLGTFVGLAAGKHRDGWGLATDSNGAQSILRATTRANDDPALASALASIDADAALLHLRAATGGLAVSAGNTHPFVQERLTFAHNGEIADRGALDQLIDPDLRDALVGDTDSERYLAVIATNARRSGLPEAIARAVADIGDVASTPSLNAIVLTDRTMYAVSSHRDDLDGEYGGDYFTLRVRVDRRGTVVASSGWGHDDWAALPNHSLLAIDRETGARHTWDLSRPAELARAA